MHMNSKPDAAGTHSCRSMQSKINSFFHFYHSILLKVQILKSISPLLIRLFLAPIFLTFGLNKSMHFDATAEWFGNADWGLGLPFPELMAGLAIGSEMIGGLFLLFGFMTRIISIPLIITMLVAIFAVHLENGWHAIAPSDQQSNIAVVTQYLGFPGAEESLQNSLEVGERLVRVRSILKEHGHYPYLTEKGSLVILNNGVEFAFTYLILLISLFFTGAGAISLDRFLLKKFRLIH